MPTIAEQNFNQLSPLFTFTGDMLPDGSALTNAGSFNIGGDGLDFQTFWADTRGTVLGPVTTQIDGDSSDFIGVNDFAGSNAPDVAPDGTPVGNGENNFEFNDGDGRLSLTFDPIDLSSYANLTVSLSYWVADTGLEADDSFSIELFDGVQSVALLALGEAELEAQSPGDAGSPDEWTTVSLDLDAAIADNGLDPTALWLIIAADTNSASENIFVDDVVIAGDLATPQEPQVVVSEIMFNPASTEDDWEWVELYNAGANSLDLAGWVIDDINSIPHASANISSGSIAAGGTAILYNADDLSAAQFEAAWGTGIELVGVTNWSAMALNNGGDTVGLWESFALYDGDNETHLNALVSVAYPDIDDGAGSIYLTDLFDQGSYAVSADGVGTPAGGEAYVAAAAGGNSGLDIGSPGGTLTPVEPTIVRIHEVQGAGDVSPLLGQTVTIEAIVVGDFQNGDADTARDLSGFYLQEEDVDADGDAATSEGIFVFDGASPMQDVNVGDLVRITGTVDEFFGETQIDTLTEVTVVSTGNALPTAASINLPTTGTTLSQDGDVQPDLESYEGMRVSFADTLTINEMFQLDRFNEIKLVQGDRPEQFTQSNLPDALGYQAHLQQVGARQIIYDDGLSVQNAPIGNLDGFQGFSDATAPSMGDTIDNLIGVLSYQWAGNSASGATWRVRATEDGENVFVDATPRKPAPADVGGTLTVATFNVLNFFTTIDGQGVSGPNGLGPRGADSSLEYDRQLEKLLTAMGEMNADIFGLVELENEFFDQNGDGAFAIGALVDAYNAAFGAAYAWVDPGMPYVGGDAITVGFIYDTVSVALSGAAAVLDSPDFLDPNATGEDRNRAAIAQTFEEVATGERFTAVVNHFKSKGASGLPTGDPLNPDSDQGDGQGFWNDTRTTAAIALDAWLGTDPTGAADPDMLILGDLNAYASEDPIKALEGLGYTDLGEKFEADGYGYVFDGQVGTLDYALASDSLSGQVSGATRWNINADEADALDYNLDFGRDPAYFGGSTPFRSSDHDPIIVGLAMGIDPTPFTLELLHLTDQEPLQVGGSFANIKNASGIINAFRGEDLGDDGLPDNTLTLSSGDAIIPGLFYSASAMVFGSAGIADIQIQNELGMQAIAFGNHEFDSGPANIAALIDGSAPGDFAALTGTALDGQDFSGTDFPYLATNLDFSTESSLAALEVEGGQAPQGNVVTSSTVLDVNGESIGVVGAVTPALASISSPGSVGISPSPFDSDPTPEQLAALAAEIQFEVDALLEANEGMNKVVLLAHMQRIEIEKQLAALLQDVDIIVAGGSNTRLFDENDRILPGDDKQGDYPEFITNAGGTRTAVVNTDGSYKYVGRLVIDFDENGNIIEDSYDAEVSGAYATDDQGLMDVSEQTGVDAEGLIDPEIAAIVDAIEDQVIQTEGNVFGVASVFLNGNRSGTPLDGVRTQETNLGNLTADANLSAAQEVDPEVVISLKNGGGIRASIGETVVPPGGDEPLRLPNGEVVDGNGTVIKPAGGISQNDIATTLAFNNGLVALTLTAQEIVDLLEHGVSAFPGVDGRFPQISGVEFSYDPDLPAGSRILSAEIVDADGNMIAPLVFDGEVVGSGEAAFRVVTLDFLSAPRFDDDGNYIGAGDGYPFPNTNTDPGAGEVGDPDVIARVNRVAFEQEDVQTGDATFADDGTEQDALAEYLNANFNPENGGMAFGEADTGMELDQRIQNLDARDDDVFDFDELYVGNGARLQQFSLGDGIDQLYLAEDLSDGIRQRFLVRDFEMGDRPGFAEEDILFSREVGPNLLVYIDNSERDSFTFFGVDKVEDLFGNFDLA